MPRIYDPHLVSSIFPVEGESNHVQKNEFSSIFAPLSHYIYTLSFHSQNHPLRKQLSLSPILQVRKLRLREVK